MKTEKIIADSMPLALKMVRIQLGDNAIIVNTRSIKTGGVFGLFGKKQYEVTAYSLDREAAPTEPKFMMELKKERPGTAILEDEKQKMLPLGQYKPSKPAIYPTEKQEVKVEHTLQAGVKQENKLPEVKPRENKMPEIKLRENEIPDTKPQAEVLQPDNSKMLEELQHLRKMMMNFMVNDKQSNALPTGVLNRMERLKKQGVDEEVIDFILASLLKKYDSINSLEDDVIEGEMRSLVESIIRNKVPVSSTIDERVRMINVIGPTGVGKTTSIAKLATEQVLKQKRRVAMITTDVYRIAAVEQLKTYAGILNVPIEVVRSADELDNALQNLRHYDLIYMDTTGRNYKEEKYREAIKDYLNHPLESDSFLVLSMTTKFDDMEVLLKEFLESPVKKLILTKFDETNTYGAILNIAFKYPYQLAYLTNGQSVPEDITRVDAALIAGFLLGEKR